MEDIGLGTFHVATDVLGLMPQWVNQTRKDACETARGMGAMLKVSIFSNKGNS